jgi:transcriptional regulator GlxA family with amidase domain
MDARVQLLTSVCTGAATLARVGVLDGRYVKSAGVSAGTDMAFYLVVRLAGYEVAEAAARVADYDWHRDPR